MLHSSRAKASGRLVREGIIFAVITLQIVVGPVFHRERRRLRGDEKYLYVGGKETGESGEEGEADEQGKDREGVQDVQQEENELLKREKTKKKRQKTQDNKDGEEREEERGFNKERRSKEGIVVSIRKGKRKTKLKKLLEEMGGNDGG